MRVIADHLRAMTFLIGDGVLPSNEWRGYVLRKIMRRAMRHGKKLGFTDPVLHSVAKVVIDEMGPAYPELTTGRDSIVRTIRAEEERFDAVLTSGLPKLEDLLEKTAASGAKTVPGDDVFRLYDSLGVPFDFAEDLAGQRGLTIDREGYDAAMEGQRERARASSKFTATGGGTAASSGAMTLKGEDRFTGYDRTTETDAEVLAVHPEADHVLVWLDKTPFYVEAGGQVSDTGTLTSASGLEAQVTGVRRGGAGNMRAHIVKVVKGQIRAGDRVTASVDVKRRDAIRRNHTATHLLHAALRKRLGTHVHQKGSLVAPDRLRFDFTHDAGLSAEERAEMESTVNEQVFLNNPVVTEERTTDEAVKAGAMALFGEKYGDRVRVVSIADYSMELCGGTHVRATGDIGPFVITEETGVAAGVRRVEALTGAGAVAHLQTQQAAFAGYLAALGVGADQATDAITKLRAEVKRLARENEQLKMKAALGTGTGAGETPDEVTVGDARFIARRVSGLEKAALRGLADSLRDRLKRGVVVLAAETDGKVTLLVSVSKDLTDRVKAGQLVKDLAPIVGGGGGGRPDFAEAGGKDPSKIDDLLAAARAALTKALT
jgi:alanyl-tRNA synthetase